MPSRRRAALTSVVGWVIVALVVLRKFGLLIGWIRFVLRPVAWFVPIGILLAAYLAIREPPEA